MVTGGQRVSQYSLTGEVTELPDLITGRHGHACSKFVSDGVTVSEGVRCRNPHNVTIFHTLYEQITNSGQNLMGVVGLHVE